MTDNTRIPSPALEEEEKPAAPQYVLATLGVLGVTLPALLLQPFIGHRAVALIYLMTVVLMALFVGRGPTFLAATLSALIWDFFFIAPVPNFRIADAEDGILFAMYFVVALVLGQLTARIRVQERTERQREARATALYLLTRALAEAAELDQILGESVEQVSRAFRARAAIFLPDAANQLILPAQASNTLQLTEEEQKAAVAAFHTKSAAAFPPPAAASVVFMRLTAAGRDVGIMALRLGQPTPLTPHQRKLLDAFSQQIAMALDRHRLRRESDETKLLKESERLSKTLLNSISHEMRTPLAAIHGAAEQLMAAPENLTGPQREMIGEIEEAAERLNRLVGNLLDITRLEAGRVKPKLDWHDLNDLIHRSLKDTRKALSRHKISVHVPSGLPLVRIDYVLMQQALINLLSNAATHTPAGTAIEVSAALSDQSVAIIVADSGKGLDPEDAPRVFDKFYRGRGAPAGGAGLGLSLVRGLVEAQAGLVTAENRPAGGAVFTIRLPLEINQLLFTGPGDERD